MNKRSWGRALLKWGYLHWRYVQGGEVKPVPSAPLGKENCVISNMPWSASSKKAGTLPPLPAWHHGCLNWTWKASWPFATALEGLVRTIFTLFAELEVVGLFLDIDLLAWMNSGMILPMQCKLPLKTSELYSPYNFCIINAYYSSPSVSEEAGKPHFKNKWIFLAHCKDKMHKAVVNRRQGRNLKLSQKPHFITQSSIRLMTRLEFRIIHALQCLALFLSVHRGCCR